MKLSKSEILVAQDFLAWVTPYVGGSRGRSVEVLRDICEREELLLLARYHFVASPAEFRNVLSRDVGIHSEMEQSRYLVGRWKKLFGSAWGPRLSVRELQGRDGVGCQYCLLRSEAYDVHHVIPQQKKGSDSPFNLVLTCPPCNKRISNNVVIPRNWWALHSESRFSPISAKGS